MIKEENLWGYRFIWEMENIAHSHTMIIRNEVYQNADMFDDSCKKWLWT